MNSWSDLPWFGKVIVILVAIEQIMVHLCALIVFLFWLAIGG